MQTKLERRKHRNVLSNDRVVHVRDVLVVRPARGVRQVREEVYCVLLCIHHVMFVVRLTAYHPQRAAEREDVTIRVILVEQRRQAHHLQGSSS